MVKITVTLDEATVERLRRTAARTGKPQSQVVREAIGEYAARADRLSDEERERTLATLERIRRELPRRPAGARILTFLGGPPDTAHA
ncbi:MAG TPA: ribbon-helix-helix protein, CopG family, partial [Candidatus Binatia bacterium]|nr:ribbon-helix-helix protein, CopG family [Candidatus Binatia bacterium]